MEESIMNPDFLSNINSKFNIDDIDLKTYSPLTLAFIGDCAYDLVIRTILVENKNRSVNSLHKDKSELVNAKAQAEMSAYFKEILTEEEMDIYKRGRNAKTSSHAKNAGINDYHKATGFECLIGYLYLDGQNDRLLEIIKLSLLRSEKWDTEKR